MFEFPPSTYELKEFVDSYHPLRFNVVQNSLRDAFSIFIKQGGRWHLVKDIDHRMIVRTRSYPATLILDVIDQEAHDVCLYN